MPKTGRSPSDAALERLRAVCFSFPATEEKLSHGSPSFFAGGKMFAGFADDHHGDGHVAAWIKAEPREQKALVAEDPERFFVPPYVGVKGWVGAVLDHPRTNWSQIAVIVENGWASVVPKKLAAGPVEPPPKNPPARKTTDPEVARAVFAKLSAICEGLPEATTERESRHATFRVRKKVFGYFLDNHHGDGFIGACFKVGKGEQDRLAAAEPARYFVPAYIGAHGYVGIRLEGKKVDWDDVTRRAAESYRSTAPKKLAALVEAEPSRRPPSKRRPAAR